MDKAQKAVVVDGNITTVEDLKNVTIPVMPSGANAAGAGATGATGAAGVDAGAANGAAGAGAGNAAFLAELQVWDFQP